ncbi:MAG: DUF3833 family protein [Caulobacteraceae bacterium]
MEGELPHRKPPLAMTWMRVAASLALLALATGSAGCAPAARPAAFASPAPIFRPETYFAGRAHSWGALASGSGAPSRHLAVESFGAKLADGSFRLDQTVNIDGAKRNRIWIIRRLDNHHYTATLTDASGLVRAETYGNIFHLKYRMKGKLGVAMEQWLYLQADGRTVLNEAVVSAFGISVARVSELITRDGPPVGVVPAATR